MIYCLAKVAMGWGGGLCTPIEQWEENKGKEEGQRDGTFPYQHPLPMGAPPPTLNTCYATGLDKPVVYGMYWNIQYYMYIYSPPSFQNVDLSSHWCFQNFAGRFITVYPTFNQHLDHVFTMQLLPWLFQARRHWESHTCMTAHAPNVTTYMYMYVACTCRFTLNGVYTYSSLHYADPCEFSKESLRLHGRTDGRTGLSSSARDCQITQYFNYPDRRLTC